MPTSEEAFVPWNLRTNPEGHRAHVSSRRLDNEVNITTFLFQRRSRLSRRMMGFPTSRESGEHGLRTDEMALAMGITESKYVELESGHACDYSIEDLDNIATVLQLSDDEYSQLRSVVRRPPFPKEIESNPAMIRLCWLPDHVEQSSVLILDSSFNIVGCNRFGGLLFEPIFSSKVAVAGDEINLARFLFLDGAAREFYEDWTIEASAIATSLRLSVAKQPLGNSVRQLLSQLSCFSEEFRARWSGHDRDVPSARKVRLNHPRLGPLNLNHRTTYLNSGDPDEHRWDAVYSYLPELDSSSSGVFD
ncbi:helix-turn-helix transcriptional regulator [Brevibacterium sp. CFH 10365]|uniref:helix-turn-helix transcriptional regulator n=1 Tax=Brevibacterium sp. CFH 10365 TaxID=2585207 RepID=UPI00126640D8|nr:helix-turn-helix transcriptional regulator [Brevibacterium sp. CFH 10365]